MIRKIYNWDAIEDLMDFDTRTNRRNLGSGFEKGHLRYEPVSNGKNITVYEVRLNDDIGTSQGFRAVAHCGALYGKWNIVDRSIYENNGHLERVEVVVNGPGLSKARKKIESHLVGKFDNGTGKSLDYSYVLGNQKRADHRKKKHRGRVRSFGRHVHW